MAAVRRHVQLGALDLLPEVVPGSGREHRTERLIHPEAFGSKVPQAEECADHRNCTEDDSMTGMPKRRLHAPRNARVRRRPSEIANIFEGLSTERAF